MSMAQIREAANKIPVAVSFWDKVRDDVSSFENWVNTQAQYLGFSLERQTAKEDRIYAANSTETAFYSFQNGRAIGYQEGVAAVVDGSGRDISPSRGTATPTQTLEPQHLTAYDFGAHFSGDDTLRWSVNDEAVAKQLEALAQRIREHKVILNEVEVKSTAASESFVITQLTIKFVEKQ